MFELNRDESDLLKSIKYYLASRTPEESDLVDDRFKCLNALGQAVSLYPSVRNRSTLRGVHRNEEHLLQTICSFASPSRILHIPARVVAARSYLVAKFQAFSMLHILAGQEKDFFKPLREIILSVIHTIMAEEVYLACLDSPDFSVEVKTMLADDLISLWDSGSDPRAVRLLPALDELWNAWNSSPLPCFGTMNASSELLQITINMGDDWREFLAANLSNDQMLWALEEFLFGLSYEEINSVKTRLAEKNISAVGRDEIHLYLGQTPVYSAIDTSDYRCIYDFYSDRRQAALFRQRMPAPGPWHTLEEIYLKYRIVQG